MIFYFSLLRSKKFTFLKRNAPGELSEIDNLKKPDVNRLQNERDMVGGSFRTGERMHTYQVSPSGASRVGGHIIERETLLRPHVVFAGYRKISKRDLPSESPTIVMLMARAFSTTLQGPISLVHKTDFRFLFYALSSRFWYITWPPTRLAPEGLTWLAERSATKFSPHLRKIQFIGFQKRGVKTKTYQFSSSHLVYSLSLELLKDNLWL